MNFSYQYNPQGVPPQNNGMYYSQRPPQAQNYPPQAGFPPQAGYPPQTGYPQQPGQFQQPLGYPQQQPYGMGMYPPQQQGGFPQQNAYGGVSPDVRTEQIISKLKYSINFHKIDLAELFCKYDKSADATLDQREFGDLLQKIDPSIQAYDIVIVFQKFDSSRNGTITFQEFCTKLGKFTDACSQQYDPQALKLQSTNAEQAIEKLKMAIQYYRIDLQQLFAKYDQSGNQNLNIHEFGQLLKKMEPNISLQEIDLAFKKFDADRSGTITFNEFSYALYQPAQQFGGYPQQQYPQQNMGYQQPAQQNMGYVQPPQQGMGYAYPQQQGMYPNQPAQQYPQYQQQVNYQYPQQQYK